MKKILVLCNILILSLLLAFLIHREENYRKQDSFYLTIAPIDPRSILQGDYMVLDYELANTVSEIFYKENEFSRAKKGFVKVYLDANKVAQFVSLEKEAMRDDKNFTIAFQNQYSNINFGVESYLFEEGKAEKFNQAKYAKVTLRRNGSLRLLALMDENFQEILINPEKGKTKE